MPGTVGNECHEYGALRRELAAVADLDHHGDRLAVAEDHHGHGLADLGQADEIASDGRRPRWACG